MVDLLSDGKTSGAHESAPAAATSTNGKAESTSKGTDDEVAATEPELFENKRPLSEKEIIYLLCDWAITTKRCGWHRIFYAVFLIRKRQIDWITQFKQTMSARKSGHVASSRQKAAGMDTATTEVNPASKKLADEDSDIDEELISRKRKFKLNESDESDPSIGKAAAESKAMSRDGKSLFNHDYIYFSDLVFLEWNEHLLKGR